MDDSRNLSHLYKESTKRKGWQRKMRVQVQGRVRNWCRRGSATPTCCQLWWERQGNDCREHVTYNASPVSSSLARPCWFDTIQEDINSLEYQLTTSNSVCHPTYVSSTTSYRDSSQPPKGTQFFRNVSRCTSNALPNMSQVVSNLLTSSSSEG